MVTGAWLQKAVLFGALDKAQLEVLLADATEESFSEGKVVFAQGEEATRLYVLIEGVVELKVKTEDKFEFMTSRIDKEGAVFGMPCLIESCRYNVTATCLRPSRVLVIRSEHIRKSMEQDPRMGMQIMGKLASIYFDRLNDMRSGVSNLIRVLKPRIP